jgi:hypothetical protein
MADNFMRWIGFAFALSAVAAPTKASDLAQRQKEYGEARFVTSSVVNAYRMAKGIVEIRLQLSDYFLLLGWRNHRWPQRSTLVGCGSIPTIRTFREDLIFRQSIHCMRIIPNGGTI